MASAAFVSLILVFCVLFQSTESLAKSLIIIDVRERPSRSRVFHATELLGPKYKKSVVQRTTEMVSNVYPFMQVFIERALPKSYKSQSDLIATTLLRESEKYNLDPIFVMALISQESSFNPEIRGPKDELGLMQLRPDTAKMLAKKFKISYDDRFPASERYLRDPITSIKLGTANLAYLRDKFDSRSAHYIGAYNLGENKVRQLLSQKVTPYIYPGKVMARYEDYYKQIARIARRDHISKTQGPAVLVSFKPGSTPITRANYDTTYNSNINNIGALSAWE
ncbi:MAG: lytic transglycosylase domain-containing protein [Bdellovibrionota bacterium]